MEDEYQGYPFHPPLFQSRISAKLLQEVTDLKLFAKAGVYRHFLRVEKLFKLQIYVIEIVVQFLNNMAIFIFKKCENWEGVKISFATTLDSKLQEEAATPLWSTSPSCTYENDF